MELIFSAIAFLGMVAARVGHIKLRGDTPGNSALLAFAGMFATWGAISLFLWGFFSLPWYWPVSVFIVSSIANAVIINRSTLGAWFAISAPLDFLTIAGVLYLWVWHWPF